MGKELTREEVNRISVEALVAGGASRQLARDIVAKSQLDLRNSGVRVPTDLPYMRGKKMTEEMSRERLDLFAKRLVFVSRDYSISLLLEYLNNPNRLPKRIAKALSTLDDEQLFMLKYFLISAVDTTFHDTMWSIESYHDHKIVIGDDDSIDVENACDEFVGAGLTGSVLEFIDEFSKYNTADEFLETGELEKVQNKS